MVLKFLYLILDLGSISIPLFYSFFERKFSFSRNFKNALISILLVAIPFLTWDAVFTKIGVWGFNDKYHLSLNLIGMPIEEWLFFICIPYACLFLHESLRYYIPDYAITKQTTKFISILLIIIALVILVFNFGRKYTTYNLLLFLMIMFYSLKYKFKSLQEYLPSFLVIIIPFIVVNGILTGSFIDEEVVWYNNAENMGKRFFTIPYEDFFYAFNMLFPTQLIFNSLQNKKA